MFNENSFSYTLQCRVNLKKVLKLFYFSLNPQKYGNSFKTTFCLNKTDMHPCFAAGNMNCKTQIIHQWLTWKYNLKTNKMKETEIVRVCV